MEPLKIQESKLVHLGRIEGFPQPIYLLLRQIVQNQYRWFYYKPYGEEETDLFGRTPAEAIQLAKKSWRLNHFRTVNCGFRYTLPERDEHGSNALFCQMAASYSSPNGIYFDEEIGSNCYVNFASTEAKNFLNRS